MSILVLVTALLALLSLPNDVHAHGYLSSPRSRNWVANQDEGWQTKEYCPDCLNRKASWETCGRSESGRNYDQDQGPNIQATYTSGQQIDLSVTLKAHHKGHFTFKACPISSGQQPTQACFDANRLRFISGHGANFDPNYPDRAYIPPAPPGTQAANGSGRWDYQYKFQLPAGLSGERVLLQWHYITANGCLPPGYDRYQFPAGWHPGNLGACRSLPLDGSVGPALTEQFWNCAEVRITGSGVGGTSPTSCPAVMSQCGPGKTCASIGLPGQCCSQYGWCGTSAAHCGTCCQNGCSGTSGTSGTQCAALTGQCGPGKTCPSGECCSQYGWCGTSSAHCGACCQNGCTSAPSLGDWAQCSKNSQCRNGCCSGMYSGGVLKCTPLSGGVFNPNICTAV